MKGVIDRFEGAFAVVETENGNINIPRKYLERTAEGDVIEFTKNSNGVFNIAAIPEETKKRAACINALMENLFQE